LGGAEVIAEFVAATHLHGVNWTEVGTISGLLIGGVGALAAGVGLRYQGQQHRRLTTELAKRADFEMTVALNPAVGGVEPGPDHSVIVRTTASAMNLRFQIGLRNSGSLAATHVSVDFLTAAQGAGGFYWTDEEGNPDADGIGPVVTSEQLGLSYATTRWLSLELPRVAKKAWTLLYATLEVTLPNDGSLDVHARGKATSDDLPDEVSGRIGDLVVRVRRPDDQT
jgi:hypothetical protein